MGYTHYWHQKRNFTIPQWQEFIADLRVILNHAQHVEGIPLADGMGKGGTQPVITDDIVQLNGLGPEDDHETFYIERKIRKPDYAGRQRGWDFCKTAAKPYDRVVTAVLAYLATVTRKEDPKTHEPIIGSEQYRVSSDGDGSDWLAGVDLVRAALPRVANIVDIPLAVMQADRWCGPWVNVDSEKTGIEVHFCVDAHGYVLRPHTGESYRFETHADLARWLDEHKVWGKSNGVRRRTSWGSYDRDHEPDIWRATGTFDQDRHARIARLQKRVLLTLFPVPREHAHQPPLFVRPGEMPQNAGREFCYSIDELLNKLEGKSC